MGCKPGEPDNEDTIMPEELEPKRRTRLTRSMLLTAALAALGASTAVVAAQPGSETIYGHDDRVEIFTLAGARARVARDTVALVDAGSIRNNGNGTSTLLGPTLRIREDLCPGQRFASQPAIAFCSGVLLTPTVVATAGHCVSRETLASIRFVFDFAMQDATRARTTLPNSRIYRARRILARQQNDLTRNDYAVIQLDRRVTDRQPAAFRRTGRIATGAALYVIGHPNGLPAKLADHASVQDNTDRVFFTANLDTFAGNSGSPVLEAATNRVAGILSTGDPDYVGTSRGCNVVNVEPDRPGNEIVTRSTVFAPFVPVE